MRSVNVSGVETPLNLSTKPKSKAIWSPASLCEEEHHQRRLSLTGIKTSSSTPTTPVSPPPSPRKTDSSDQHNWVIIHFHNQSKTKAKTRKKKKEKEKRKRNLIAI